MATANWRVPTRSPALGDQSLSCLGYQQGLWEGRRGGGDVGCPVIQPHVIDDQGTTSLGPGHQWEDTKLVVGSDQTLAP